MKIENNQLVRVKEYNMSDRPKHVVASMLKYEGKIVKVSRVVPYADDRLFIEGDNCNFVWLDKDFVKVNNGH